MRMPRSQIGGETYRKRCVLDAFVQLKEMRMACAHADPDNFRRALGRKCSDTFNRQKEGAKFNCLKFFAQRKIDILRNVGEKPERQVHLIAGRPTGTANAGIKIDQNFSD